MTISTALAAAAGALLAAGGWCLAAGFVGVRGDAAARPPPRWRRLLASWDRRQRRRALAAATAGFAVLLLTRWPVGAVAAAAAVLAVPRVVSARVPAQQIARLEALEQWTRRLADMLGASRGLEEALTSSARNPPPPIAVEVRRMAARLGMRMRTEDALYGFADDLGDELGDHIAAALIRAATLRGPGARMVLTELARMVAADVAARRDVEAERSRYRTEMRWLVFFFLGGYVMAVARPSWSAPYDTPVGQLVLACVVGLSAAGLWWFQRLTTTPPGPRFLSSADRPAAANPTLAGEAGHR